MDVSGDGTRLTALQSAKIEQTEGTIHDNMGHNKETGGNSYVTPSGIVNNDNNKRGHATLSEEKRGTSHETPSGKKIASNLRMTLLPPNICHASTHTGDDTRQLLDIQLPKSAALLTTNMDKTTSSPQKPGPPSP